MYSTVSFKIQRFFCLVASPDLHLRSPVVHTGPDTVRGPVTLGLGPVPEPNGFPERDDDTDDDGL